jgi:hypothetical protein
MKYVALAFLGLITVQAIKFETSIAKFKQNQDAEFAEMSDEIGVEDALVHIDKPCVYLDETIAELEKLVDLYQETLIPDTGPTH